MTTELENSAAEEETTEGTGAENQAVDGAGVEGAATDDPAAESEKDVEVGSPEYQSFDNTGPANENGDLARLQNIQIAVTAELGRATLPIQELMQLAEGSVVELDRAIDSPIDLIAQGVTLASGEVVVVDGCFAIRILNVHDNK
jgi:flagellar motor switch protein FliN/FliY